MDEDLIKWAEKIKEHFQYVDATTQVVLKGHLLRGYPGTSYRFRRPLFGNGIQGGAPG